MTVQFLVITSPSSRQSRNGFSFPSALISLALISSWRLRSASKQPLLVALVEFRAYLIASGPATKPPKMQETNEFAPSRLAPWRSEEHTSELQSPDHLVC